MSDLDMRILDRIFKTEPVTEEYIPFCDILLLAFRAKDQEEEADLYEKAGFEMMKTPKDSEGWGRYLIEVAQRIDRKNDRLGRFV